MDGGLSNTSLERLPLRLSKIVPTCYDYKRIEI